MKRFQLFFLAAYIAGASSGGFFLLTMPAQAKQCSSERPANARSHWSYRIIDGRKCWYEGKPCADEIVIALASGASATNANDREPLFLRTFTTFSMLKLPFQTIPRVSNALAFPLSGSNRKLATGLAKTRNCHWRIRKSRRWGTATALTHYSRRDVSPRLIKLYRPAVKKRLAGCGCATEREVLHSKDLVEPQKGLGPPTITLRGLV